MSQRTTKSTLAVLAMLVSCLGALAQGKAKSGTLVKGFVIAEFSAWTESLASQGDLLPEQEPKQSPSKL